MKKRILFIHHGVGIGGAPHSLRLLILSLDTTVYDPVVLFLWDSPAIDLFRDSGIQVVGPVRRIEFSHTVIWWYRWYHAHHMLRALWDWCAVVLFDAARWFDELKPDIVHLNTSSLSAWGLYAWFRKIPVVWHIRESLAPGYLGLRRAVVRFLVGLCAAKIVAISTHDGRFWAGNMQLQILPNPVDCDVFAPSVQGRASFRAAHEIPENAKVLVYLGGLSREKGALLALEILEKLLDHRNDVYLVIAGTWQIPQSSIVRRVLGTQAWYELVATLVGKYQKNIRFTGVLPSTHVILQAGDCLLFPAQKGHFARPVLEAGAVGLPVLASRLPPLDELVQEGLTGFLCSPADADEWVARIEQVFSLDLTVFLPARAWVVERFSVPAYARVANQLYQKL